MASIAEYIATRCEQRPIHVLGLTETWANKSEKNIKKEWISQHRDIHKQYIIYTDRLVVETHEKTKGNGTMIFLHRSLRPFVKSVLRIPGRGIALKLGKNKEQNIMIGVIYKEHNMLKKEEMELIKPFQEFGDGFQIKILGTLRRFQRNSKPVHR